MSEEEKKQKIRTGVAFLLGVGVGFALGVVYMLTVYVQVWG